MNLLKIDQTDLKVLFAHTKHAYGNISFTQWCDEVEKSYLNFIKGKENPKTYSQWINGQIIYLTK